MELLEILKLPPKTTSLWFRHNPNLINDLKLLLTNTIVLDGSESASELCYLFRKNITEIPVCVCGKKLEYVKFSVGYKTTCGNKICIDIVSNKKRKITCNEKFGGNAPSCSKEVTNKMKKTSIERYGVGGFQNNLEIKKKKIETNLKLYGVEWSAQNPDIRKKTTDTMVERYGKEHSLQVPEIMLKSKESHLKKFGYDNNFKSPEIRKEIEKTIMEKYDVKHPMQSEIVKEKLINTSIKRYGVSHPSKNNEIKNKISNSHKKNFIDRIENNPNFKFINWLPNNRYLLKSNTTGDDFVITKTIFGRRNNNNLIDLTLYPLHQPLQQKEIVKFIKTIYDGEIIENDRTILGGKHLDIFLPELNIGIEYDGLYWHSEIFKEKNYHINKTKLCKDNNIFLIHIFEDEWLYKKDIVKSILKNKLNTITNRIYARKCVIKEINSFNCEKFLNENHIQGSCASKIKIGLYYNDELVSIMTFGNERICMGKKSINDSYEMIRFCNKLDTNIIGGASKLFNYFIKTYNPKNIISYSNNRWFDGSLYKNLGLNYILESKPNYWYIIGNKRKHRFNFRKNKLIDEGFNPSLTEHEIMLSRKIFRIYDCGNKKFALIL